MLAPRLGTLHASWQDNELDSLPGPHGTQAVWTWRLLGYLSQTSEERQVLLEARLMCGLLGYEDC